MASILLRKKQLGLRPKPQLLGLRPRPPYSRFSFLETRASPSAPPSSFLFFIGRAIIRGASPPKTPQQSPRLGSFFASTRRTSGRQSTSSNNAPRSSRLFVPQSLELLVVSSLRSSIRSSLRSSLTNLLLEPRSSALRF